MCDSRCWYAKGPTCNCGCGGANHGSGIGGFRSSRRTRRSGFGSSSLSRQVSVKFRPTPTFRTITNVVKNVAVPIAIRVNPYVGAVYTTYKTVDFGYTLYNQIKNEDTKGLLGDIREYLSSKISESVKEASESKAEEVAEKVMTLAESSGIIKEISEKTNVDSSIYSIMLKGSVKNALVEGAGKLAEYAIKSVG